MYGNSCDCGGDSVSPWERGCGNRLCFSGMDSLLQHKDVREHLAKYAAHKDKKIRDLENELLRATQAAKYENGITQEKQG